MQITRREKTLLGKVSCEHPLLSMPRGLGWSDAELHTASSSLTSLSSILYL